MTRILATAMIAALATSGAFAKGHDQSNTDVPGESTGAETVAPAQTLGGGKGNRPDDRGPSKSQGPARAGR